MAPPQHSGSLLTPKNSPGSVPEMTYYCVHAPRSRTETLHAHAYPFRCSRLDIHGKLSSLGTGFQEPLLLRRVFDETVHRENQMIGCA